MPTAARVQRAIPLLALISLVAFSAGVFFATGKRASGPEIPGLLWPDPPASGEFTLTGGDGKPFARTDLIGRWTLMFFGFTNCPDVCPTTLAVLKDVDRRLGDVPAWRDQGQVVFVSVDPERDTPARIDDYVKHFDPRFRAATGPDEALQPLTRSLGILHAKVDGGGPSGYSIDHTASILLLDPRARLVGVFSLPHDAADIAERYTRIQRFLDKRS